VQVLAIVRVAYKKFIEAPHNAYARGVGASVPVLRLPSRPFASRALPTAPRPPIPPDQSLRLPRWRSFVPARCTMSWHANTIKVRALARAVL